MKENLKCKHCNDSITTNCFNDENGFNFCCQGCLSVYSIIHSNNLDHYYQIKDQLQNTKLISKRKINTFNSKQYNFLDSEEFKKRHLKKIQNKFKISFYLEGIHCIACLWLIEKVPSMLEGVSSSRLDMGKNTVEFQVSKECQLSKLASTLHSLGYKPHPVQNETQIEKYKREEKKKDFLRLGVSAFCSMNQMLYSVSLYAGANGVWKSLFSYINFSLSLPIVFFCAIPFYKQALSSFRNKHLSIDTPISLAIIAGFIFSSINLFYARQGQYFDSIGVLVFFLLLSRTIQMTFQSKHLNKANTLQYFERSDILQFNDSSNEFEYVSQKDLKVGNILKITPKETLACDGVVQDGSSFLQLSVLNGEPYPKQVIKGDKVFAGSVNIDDTFLIKITSIGNETKLGKILKEVHDNLSKKSPLSTHLEYVTRLFLKFIFLISAIAFFYFLNQSLLLACQRSLVLLIVTCPCALALATPLAFSKALSTAQKHNIILKNENIFERMCKIKNIFLDKTGTLTQGIYSVVKWEEKAACPFNNLSFYKLILLMEKNSSHPIANSICNYIIQESNKIATDNIDDINNIANNIIDKNFHAIEIIGLGVRAEYQNRRLELKEVCVDQNIKKIGLYIDDKLQVSINLQDSITSDAKEIIKKWNNNLFNLFLISGDNKESSLHIGQILNINKDKIYSKQTPDSKAKIVQKYENSLMIGDGFNDTLAFTKASVSIAVTGSVEASLNTADVFCLEDGLSPINKLFIISTETLIIIKRNILFSIIYNIIAVFLVFLGKITPLSAAILMPISSLTVIFSTIIATKKLRKLN